LAVLRKQRTPGRLPVLILLLLCLGPLGGQALAMTQLTLGWDPSSNGDVQGYGIYYTTGPAGPPYDLFGYVAKEELADAGAPAFTVSSLQQGTTYRFAVTAYDADGNESRYSNQVCAQLGDTLVRCAAVVTGDGSPNSASAADSGGGGGGGGGCFIRTASASDFGAAWLPAAGALATFLSGCLGAVCRR